MGKRGPAPHEPTKAQRQKALTMTMAGIPQTDIARTLGISKPTLHKHYREQLDIGMDEANAMVAGTLYNLCIKGNLGAIVWWEKTRRGFKDKLELMSRRPQDLDEITQDMTDQEAAENFQAFLERRSGKS